MLVLLIEHSYIDQATINHLSNSFYFKYKLNYLNDPTSSLGGNVRFLVGHFDPSQIGSNLQSILNQLDSYSPFIQLLYVYYDRFWFGRSQLNQLIDFAAKGNLVHQNQIALFQHSQILLIDSLLKLKSYSLVHLLQKKKIDGF